MVSISQLADISKAAGDFLLSFQNSNLKIEQNYKDFVTQADLESEKIILSAIKRLAPGIETYSEEAGGTMPQNGWCTVVDPLDGTVNYFHQDYFWGVSIGLLQNGLTEKAVIYLPKLNQLYAAVAQDKILKTASKSIPLNQAQIWLDWMKGPKEPVINLMKVLSEISLYPQIRLSAVGSFAKVISGEIEAYLHPGPKPEDIAAACLITEKYGGRVTDFKGNPWHPLSKNILATRTGFSHHDELLEKIKNIF